MHIKQVPEDFIVDEIASYDILDEGRYLLVCLKKRNMTTERAISHLARRLGLPRKAISYAGTKDSRAVTSQHVSIQNRQGVKGRLSSAGDDQVTVRLLGCLREPIGLGMLDGNMFTITCRGLENERIKIIPTVPNYFDEQRFSTANARIGRLLVHERFSEAVDLILKTDPGVRGRMESHLLERKNDAVGALRLIPRNVLLMYVHAFQSELYNRILSMHILKHDPDATVLDGPIRIVVPGKSVPQVSIPLIGFDTALSGQIGAWAEEILREEGLCPRDFVTRSIPHLTLEGTLRDAFIVPQDISISDREPDELNEGFEKQAISFSLPSGAYATIVVKCFYGTGEILKN